MLVLCYVLSVLNFMPHSFHKCRATKPREKPPPFLLIFLKIFCDKANFLQFFNRCNCYVKVSPFTKTEELRGGGHQKITFHPEFEERCLSSSFGGAKTSPKCENENTSLFFSHGLYMTSFYKRGPHKRGYYGIELTSYTFIRDSFCRQNRFSNTDMSG